MKLLFVTAALLLVGAFAHADQPNMADPAINYQAKLKDNATHGFQCPLMRAAQVERDDKSQPTVQSQAAKSLSRSNSAAQ